MATWEGIKGICQPCRDLLVADKPFNCEQGPRSTNWICQTCHENGDESVVGERVIKLSGCTFPIQARKISKEAKEAWRLFTTINPKDCRQSVGGHLAAARRLQVQEPQIDVPSSPLEPSGDGVKKSLVVCLSIGKSRQEGQINRRDCHRNNQDWSITLNRPPTPPESLADSHDVANQSGKPSPLKPHFTQAQEMHDQTRHEWNQVSRRPSEASDSLGKQNTLAEGSDEGVSIVSSTTRKKRKLHRGLKHRPASPIPMATPDEVHPPKRLKVDSSFHSNETLLENWTNTAKRRPSEGASISERAGSEGAISSSFTLVQPVSALSSTSPVGELIHATERQDSIEVSEEISTSTKDLGTHSIGLHLSDTNNKSRKESSIELDQGLPEEIPTVVDQNLTEDASLGAKQPLSDSQTAESNPDPRGQRPEEPSTANQQVDRIAPIMEHQPHSLVIVEHPIYNAYDRELQTSLTAATALGFPAPQAWYNSTQTLWKEIHATMSDDSSSDIQCNGEIVHGACDEGTAQQQGAPNIEMHVSQPQTLSQSVESAAPSRPAPKHMVSDYVEDMLAAARQTQASSPNTKTTYSIQWSAINAPTRDQSTTVTSRDIPGPVSAPANRRHNQRSRALNTTALPRLEPTPAAFENEQAISTVSADSRARAVDTSPNFEEGSAATQPRYAYPWMNRPVSHRASVGAIEPSLSSAKPIPEAQRELSHRAALRQDRTEVQQTMFPRQYHSHVLPRTSDETSNTQRRSEPANVYQNTAPSLGHSDIFTRYPQSSQTRAPVPRRQASKRSSAQNLARRSSKTLTVPSHAPKLPQMHTSNPTILPQGCPTQMQHARPNIHQQRGLPFPPATPILLSHGQPMQFPRQATSPTTLHPNYLPMHQHHQAPHHAPNLEIYLQSTKLSICVGDTTETYILRLGYCRNTEAFIRHILTHIRVLPALVEKFRVTFTWKPEGRGKTFVMRLDELEKEDAMGHILDELTGEFGRSGYAVTTIDVDVLLR